MTVLERFAEVLPDWMFDAPRRHVADVMQGISAVYDALGEVVFLARTAAMPGQVELPGIEGWGGYDNWDALPMIGRDRSIRKGWLESWPDYAERLRRWIDDWTDAGTVPQLLEQLAAILGPDPPMLRLIETNGTWWTRDPDGTIEQLTQAGKGFRYDPVTGDVTAQHSVPHLWNWDSLSVPPTPDKTSLKRFWIVIYAPCNGVYLADDDNEFADPGTVGDFGLEPGTSGAGIGPDGGTIGTCSPKKHVELIRSLIQEWRTAGVPCRHVIVTFDPASFNPITDSTPTSIPDGKQGWHSWFDVATNTRIPKRFPNAEYWPGTPGGVH